MEEERDIAMCPNVRSIDRSDVALGGGIEAVKPDRSPFPDGGGGTASLKVANPLPNYHPRFSGLFAPSVYFELPLFWWIADHRLLKSYFLNTRSYTKGT